LSFLVHSHKIITVLKLLEREYGNFSDVNDCELLYATQLVEQIECGDIKDCDLVEASQTVEKLEHSAEHCERQFASPVS